MEREAKARDRAIRNICPSGSRIALLADSTDPDGERRHCSTPAIPLRPAYGPALIILIAFAAAALISLLMVYITDTIVTP